jgi:hypothetical protein
MTVTATVIAARIIRLLLGFHPSFFLPLLATAHLLHHRRQFVEEPLWVVFAVLGHEGWTKRENRVRIASPKRRCREASSGFPK